MIFFRHSGRALVLGGVWILLLATGNPAGAQTVVFQADFQNSVVQNDTSLSNLTAGTETGSWSSSNTNNLNVYGDATGTQKAFCPDSDGNGGYAVNANFSAAAPLASNVTVNLLLAVGRYNSPGTGKAFTITGYDSQGNASFDLKVFGNENQAAGTNGAVYWNSSAGYTNWFGTNFSAAGDIRQITVGSTNYNPAGMSALQIQLFASGYVILLDSNDDGIYEWVSSLLPYKGSPASISQISIVGGPGAGDWFDNMLVTEGTGGGSNDVYIAIQPESEKQLVTGWGYDIKGVSGYTVTPAYAQTLFVTNRMNILRLPIWGDAADPAHPSAGVVIGSYYADSLYAMTNALAANSNVIFFASKKLDGQNSFPAWVKNSNGVIASEYALMLADYLEFMATNGFAINVLGIDNEREYNEGNITPSVYNDVIDALRPLAASRGFPLPTSFIAPENYFPDTIWLTTLVDDGWGTNVQIVGTHYYPASRPYNELVQLVATGGSRPDWHSEVHWDGSFGDVIDNAEAALATVFDCTDNNFSAFVWWQYTQSGVQGGIEQAFSFSTAQSHPVPAVDQYGVVRALGELNVRAFRGSTNLVIWALNNTTNVYTNCNVSIDQGTLVGAATYNEWNVSGVSTGSVNVASATNFAVTLGAQTISEIMVGYQSPVSNSPPVLAAISNQTLIAGQVLVVTNSATDAEVPAPTLTWSIQPAISGLTINATNGVVSWRPAIKQAPSTNVISVIVSDNGTPSLSATQQFTVTVLSPAAPLLSVSAAQGGEFPMQVSGDAGPDYMIEVSTNLAGTNWQTLYVTNPAALPFSFTDTTASNYPTRFYRVLLGP